MKYRFTYSLTAAVLAAALFMIPAVAQRAANTAAAKAADPATPRMADGHPNLSGTWHATSGHVRPNGTPLGEKLSDGSRIASYAQRGREDRPAQAQPAPQPQEPRSPRSAPSYKPELLAKVRDLEAHQSKTDPSFTCAPPGLPRVGPPHKIVQGIGELVILYSDVTGNFWRIVPFDGRGHNEDFDPSYFGDSVGHWEGDTLVVDVTNFNEDFWLGDLGYFHSKSLHVTERISRQGNKLYYDVTVEDPSVLTKPWKLDQRVLSLSNEALEEAPFCKDLDQAHVVNLDHHGMGRE